MHETSNANSDLLHVLFTEDEDLEADYFPNTSNYAQLTHKENSESEDLLNDFVSKRTGGFKNTDLNFSSDDEVDLKEKDVIDKIFDEVGGIEETVQNPEDEFNGLKWEEPSDAESKQDESGQEEDVIYDSDENIIPNSSDPNILYDDDEETVRKDPKIANKKHKFSKKEIELMKRESERLIRETHIDIPQRKSKINMNDFLTKMKSRIEEKKITVKPPILPTKLDPPKPKLLKLKTDLLSDDDLEIIDDEEEPEKKPINKSLLLKPLQKKLAEKKSNSNSRKQRNAALLKMAAEQTKADRIREENERRRKIEEAERIKAEKKKKSAEGNANADEVEAESNGVHMKIANADGEDPDSLDNILGPNWAEKEKNERVVERENREIEDEYHEEDNIDQDFVMLSANKVSEDHSPSKMYELVRFYKPSEFVIVFNSRQSSPAAVSDASSDNESDGGFEFAESLVEKGPETAQESELTILPVHNFSQLPPLAPSQDDEPNLVPIQEFYRPRPKNVYKRFSSLSTNSKSGSSFSQNEKGGFFDEHDDRLLEILSAPMSSGSGTQRTLGDIMDLLSGDFPETPAESDENVLKDADANPESNANVVHDDNNMQQDEPVINKEQTPVADDQPTRTVPPNENNNIPEDKPRTAMSEIVEKFFRGEIKMGEHVNEAEDDEEEIVEEIIIEPKLVIQKPKSAFVEEEAHESDDEFKGLGGADGDVVEDEADNAEMVFSGDEDVVEDFTDVIELHRQQVQDQDETEINALMNDVTTGNLRKRAARRAGKASGVGKGFELSDSDEDDEWILRKIKDRAGLRNRRRDEDEDTALGKYAKNPETAAFASCFETECDDRMGFISDDEDVYGNNDPVEDQTPDGKRIKRSVSYRATIIRQQSGLGRLKRRGNDAGESDRDEGSDNQSIRYDNGSVDEEDEIGDFDLVDSSRKRQKYKIATLDDDEEDEEIEEQPITLIETTGSINVMHIEGEEVKIDLMPQKRSSVLKKSQSEMKVFHGSIRNMARSGSALRIMRKTEELYNQQQTGKNGIERSSSSTGIPNIKTGLYITKQVAVSDKPPLPKTRSVAQIPVKKTTSTPKIRKSASAVFGLLSK